MRCRNGESLERFPKAGSAWWYQSFSWLALPDRDNNHRLLRGNPPPLLENIRALVEFKVAQGLLQGSDDLDNLLSHRYLPPPEV